MQENVGNSVVGSRIIIGGVFLQVVPLSVSCYGQMDDSVGWIVYEVGVAKAAGCHTVNTPRHHSPHGHDARARGIFQCCSHS